MAQQTIKFSKMHGLGNDFMVIDGIHQAVQLDADIISKLADRHFGIGFDQLLLVEKNQHDDVDFRYRIFNADGAEVEQCGNGARCFARFVFEKKLSAKNPLKVETSSGVISLLRTDNHQVRVDMGAPVFEAAHIPFDTQMAKTGINSKQQIELDTSFGKLLMSVLSMGNPHAVLLVQNTEDCKIEEIGSCLQKHPAFPKSVNVGFMQVVNRHMLRLRVYERGVGETLACGTGACAAFVAAYKLGLVDKQANLQLAGGELSISWLTEQNNDETQSVFMTGPADHVYDGEIII